MTDSEDSPDTEVPVDAESAMIGRDQPLARYVSDDGRELTAPHEGNVPEALEDEAGNVYEYQGRVEPKQTSVDLSKGFPVVDDLAIKVVIGDEGLPIPDEVHQAGYGIMLMYEVGGVDVQLHLDMDADQHPSHYEMREHYNDDSGGE